MKNPGTHWNVVVGLGEVGKAIYDVLAYNMPGQVVGYDSSAEMIRNLGPANVLESKWSPPSVYEGLHICIPWSEMFVDHVLSYQEEYPAAVTIIHSTVPIGTTAKIPGAVHSPVNGRHSSMKDSIYKHVKFIGGPLANEAKAILNRCGIKCAVRASSEETEALKLLCLAKYGVMIAMAGYCAEVSKKYGFSYNDVVEWDREYNRGLLLIGSLELCRPILSPPGETIGGHCVLPGTELMNRHLPSPLLQEVLRYGQTTKYRVWHPSNIYPSAKIGDDVNIGAFCEIGPNVRIGKGTRIGAYCFIPEGVSIEDNVWIGPRVTFANDLYPPSHRKNWMKTKVESGAVIGAGACILPGVVIGKNAMVGMGSVVTRSVSNGKVAKGNPARETEKSDRSACGDEIPESLLKLVDTPTCQKKSIEIRD